MVGVAGHQFFQQKGTRVMPIYTYKCPACKLIFERHHKMSDNPEYNCKCGTSLKKAIITPPTIRFNGKGFYSTDNQEEERQ